MTDIIVNLTIGAILVGGIIGCIAAMFGNGPGDNE